MITIETENCNPISQDFYDHIIFSLDLATLTCACGHTGQLIWYGSYARKVKLVDQAISLQVARVYCSSCGHTHAILLSSIVPYSQIPLDVQVAVIECYEQGSGFHSILDSQITMDENNIASIIRSYRQHWYQRLLSLSVLFKSLSELVRKSFQDFSRQFMQIKSTRNKLFYPPT
jgi:hypothetical protein